ncbi:MarC family transcriptional regulator [Thioclava sp. SK-1]|uniref:MarC family protein n=1 Tax=Thioclava sp. SK-1 TaxID=1889770 RepID=UPI00082553CC|nr:MarC family protein [Thioclava sp. SK-1]OCX67130.1 MarC family transcriptional regulator [Thioclava sp. SK-1]
MLSVSQILQEFITLWVVIDPIGTLPVFLAATAGMSAAQKRLIAIRAVIISLAVLAMFIVCGQLLLDALSIPLPAFQIAGGIVLFLFALTMIFGHGKPQDEIVEAEQIKQTSVYPVAIPSIASPGAMLAVVVLTDNDRFSVAHQAMTTALMAVVLSVTLALLLLANPINKIIGTSGAMVISRVMGMILAAVAVDAVLNAFVGIGVLPSFAVSVD